MLIFFACWVSSKNTSEETSSDTNSVMLDTSDTSDTSNTSDTSDTSDTGEDPMCTYGVCDMSLDLGNSVSMDFVLIPAGEDPLGRYTLTSDFYLMTTEVTQGMFQQVMGYDSREGEDTNFGNGIDFPTYYVNWHMAAAFANAVTQRHNIVNGTGLSNCYNCSGSGTGVICSDVGDPYQCTGYVLPTEAEWEYAARSGTTSEFWTGDGPDLGGTYSANSCGNGINDTTVFIQDGVTNPALSDYAWFCGSRYDSTYYNMSKPVGLKFPNGFGLYDMHGNLREWTSDWYGCSYPQSTTDPRCGTGSYRVARGGAWSGNPYYVRASDRDDVTPTYRVVIIGFRIGFHP